MKINFKFVLYKYCWKYFSLYVDNVERFEHLYWCVEVISQVLILRIADKVRSHVT